MSDMNKMLTSLALVLAMTGCGSDNADNLPLRAKESEQSQQLQQEVQFNPTFSAQFAERSKTTASQIPAFYARSFKNIPAADAPSTDIRYKGQMTVTDTLNNQTQQLEWPLTFRSDGTVVSHRTLALEPGNYDFVVLLEHNGHQYTAQSLAVDVVHNQPLLVDLKLQPHLGDTLVDLEDIGGLSKLNLSYPAEELKKLNNPKLGIAIGNGDELIFELNKDTGLSEITLAYEEGDYPLVLNLYDDNRLVGVIQQADTVINLQSGEASEVNLIPLQADVDFRFNMNDVDNTSKFDFMVPQALVDRVSGVENLAMILRLTSSTETQETLRSFQEENGRYISIDGTPPRFDTQGQERVSAYLAFYPKKQDNQYNDMPLASCTFFVDVGINQTLSCKLSVDASHRIHGHILASLMLNVQHSDMTMAKGAKVYIDGKFVGLTGSEYNTASLKTHLLPGEHQVKIEKDNSKAELTLSLSPLDVVNKLVYLKERSKGSGIFVDSGQELGENNTKDIALGDIDGDGDLDIVTVNDDSSKALPLSNRVYFNDGNGNYTDSGQLLGNYRSTSVALGDVDGDSDLDMVVGNMTRNDSRIYINDGKGRFTDSGQRWSGNHNTYDIAFGDIDGDGDLDLVEGNFGSNHVHLNNGSGVFTYTGQALGNDYTSSIALGDIDDDGDLDLVAANMGKTNRNQSTDVYINIGKGHFISTGQRLGTLVKAHPRSVGLCDIDSDGDLDMVVGHSDSYGSPNRVYINDGEGHYTDAQEVGNNSTNSIAMGDIDGDDDLDIVEGNATAQSNSSVYLNNGSGTFTNSGQELGMNSINAVVLGDIDGDGDLDMVAGKVAANRIYFNQNQ